MLRATLDLDPLVPRELRRRGVLVCASIAAGPLNGSKQRLHMGTSDDRSAVRGELVRTVDPSTGKGREVR